MVRIAEVDPLPNKHVRLRLTDGSIIERDLTILLSGPIYEGLREDPDLFKEVQVVDGTLQWPNGLDMDPDMIIWGGPPPADDVRSAG